MKKLLTLAVIAGTMAFYACNNEAKKEEGTEGGDSTKVEETAPVTPPADTTKAADTTKMSGEGDKKMEEKKEEKK